MQPYDLIMLIVLAAATIFGAIKGFAWQVASLASILASYLVAIFFRNDVAKMINAQPPWNMFLSMLLLYFGSSLIIWMAFRLVSTSIDKIKLREFDRHLGAGFGLLKGALLCLIITMFAMTLLGSRQQQSIANSRSGHYISKILANADGILPGEVKQVIGPYLVDVGRKLEQGRDPNMPEVGGVLDGLGNQIQDRLNQFGNSSGNPGDGLIPAFPGSGQGGAGGNSGGFFGGGGQGSAQPTTPWGTPSNANSGWGNPPNSQPSPNSQPVPGGWPVSQPQNQPPANGGWYGGPDFLPPRQ